MNVTDNIIVIRIFPCDWHNGSYNQDFNKKSNTTYSKEDSSSFLEILKKEKEKLQK